MSFWTALVLAIGASGWIYAQLAKRNGNANPSNNLMATGFVGLLIFIVAFTLFKFVFHF